MDGIELTDKKSLHGVSHQYINSRLSKNWYILAALAVLNSVGLAVAVAPLFGGRLADIWPWENTHFILLGGLALAVALLVVHLTVQQRKFTEIRGEVDQLELESRARERQNKERLTALLNISRVMGSVSSLEKLFKYTTDTCLQLFESQQASLMLLTADKNVLEVRAAAGHLRGDEVQVARQKVGEGVAGWVAKTLHPLLLGPGADLSQYPGLEINALNMTAAMVVPVLLRDELIGILSVRSRVPGVRYNEEDLQALQVFAENVGTVIRHSEHVEWMRKTIEKQRASQPGAPVK